MKAPQTFCILLLFLVTVGCGKAQVDKVLESLNQDSFTTPGVNTANVLENYEQVIQLEYSSSGSTLAESCSITSEVNLSVTTPCTCETGICTVGITPGTAGVGSFEYTVSNGLIESNASSYDLTIKTMVPFVSQWSITNGDTIELVLGANANISIDWGDGTVESYTEGGATISHTYGSSNTFTITISGLLESIGIGFSSRGKITSIPELGTVGWKSFSASFANCYNLTTVAGGDTSEVTDISSMFAYGSLVVPDTSGWDTSKVTNMRGVFYSAPVATPDTSGWDTSNVTDMSIMFAAAYAANPNTAGWDTSSVTNMNGMFMLTNTANPNTAGWDTSKVTNMGQMFYQAKAANPDTSSWDTSQVTTMLNMFAYTDNAIPNTSGWDTSNVTSMKGMFQNALVANPDTSGWNTTNVTDMWDMFKNSGAANPDMSGWDFSSVTVLKDMFLGNTTLSTANYDSLLVQLDQTATAAFAFNAGGATYTNGGAGDTARQSLVAKLWTFTDGGGI